MASCKFNQLSTNLAKISIIASAATHQPQVLSPPPNGPWYSIPGPWLKPVDNPSWNPIPSLSSHSLAPNILIIFSWIESSGANALEWYPLEVNRMKCWATIANGLATLHGASTRVEALVGADSSNADDFSTGSTGYRRRRLRLHRWSTRLLKDWMLGHSHPEQNKRQDPSLSRGQKYWCYMKWVVHR